ncbi:MAG TPA: penicillin-binding protein 2 [Halomicronema sp.]
MDAVPPPNSKLNRFKGRKNNQRLSVVRNNSTSQGDARRKGKGKTGIPSNQQKPLQRRSRRRLDRLASSQGMEVSIQQRRFRLFLVWGILLAGSLGLTLNLVSLQVFQGSDLRSRALAQQQVAPTRKIPRRPIIDRQGNFLAIDRPVYTLYAHPMMFNQPQAEVAEKLAPLLQRPKSELIALFAQEKTGIKVSEFLAEQVRDRIVELRIDGLELLDSYARLYPYQDLAAEVVGYVDAENVPQAGVEYSFSQLLGRNVPPHTPGFVAIDELRLQLTLDSRLQRAARLALSEKMTEFKAKRGTVIVMDALDGSLLALVCEPTYDPNQYFNYDLSRFKNWAVSDIYEPGSTFKPLTFAIALEAGTVQPDSVVYDSGQLYVNGATIGNADGAGRGTISLTEVMQYSNNVGTAQVAFSMQQSVFYKWLVRLGLGSTLATDLPFAGQSQILSEKEFLGGKVNAATTAFGQSFAITPLQLVEFYGALANGGKLVTPHVVKGLVDSEDKFYWQPTLEGGEEIFSPSTTKAVIGMMEKVVTDGTGTAAQIPGYRIAGKTGTAQKSAASGGYSDYAKVVSFAAVVPAESPRYVVVAVVDEPVGGSGGAVGAPIVKSVIEALIALEKIPPTKAGL